MVLDLFSGSGAMAIESISRGAMKAICVDNSNNATSIIKNNLNKLKINNIDIYKQDCISFLKDKKGTKYDLIFLDPPYVEFSLLNKALEIISTYSFLNKYGKIIIENNDENFMSVVIPKTLIIYKTKNYGKTRIIYLNNIL